VRAVTGLPPFSGDTRCAKCGQAGGHGVEYVPKSMLTRTGHMGECLERRCARCGYTWAEAVVAGQEGGTA